MVLNYSNGVIWYSGGFYDIVVENFGLSIMINRIMIIFIVLWN